MCRVSDTGPLMIYPPVLMAGVRKPSGKEPAGGGVGGLLTGYEGERRVEGEASSQAGNWKGKNMAEKMRYNKIIQARLLSSRGRPWAVRSRWLNVFPTCREFSLTEMFWYFGPTGFSRLVSRPSHGLRVMSSFRARHPVADPAISRFGTPLSIAEEQARMPLGIVVP